MYSSLHPDILAVVTVNGTNPQLHEVDPREQAGASSGDRFEFQYHQAAADALHVLDESQVACVYCEWHDDYVIEAAGIVAYRFHQVKTRSSSQGPWTLNEFFGIKRTRGPSGAVSVTADSIFGRLLDHVAKFGDRCECFVFVSDAGASNDFEGLLDAVRSETGPDSLSGDSATEFEKLQSALVSVHSTLTRQNLFAFLSKLYIREALGKLGDLKACRTLIGGRIYEMSEVNLTMSEAQKIGANLVAAVRERSHRVLKVLPASTTELRATKGLVLDDVLRILSLSSAGYRELQSSGRDRVVTLSRLHRLCQRSNVPEVIIPDLCRLKTNWEAWWIAQRHHVNSLDLISMKKACADVLSVHAKGNLDFSGLRAEAKNIASKYAKVLTSTEPITEELVVGLLMSLAVEAES